MNPTHQARALNQEAGSATRIDTTRRHHVQATDGGQNPMRFKESMRQSTTALSPVVHQVVEGFMESLQSSGEGVLPIVLALQPELSTHGIPESDVEFTRRGRRQTAAEKRFFRTIETTLRDAMETILYRAAHAAMRRRAGKDRNLMAAGGRPHLNRTLATPRASFASDTE